MWIVEINFAGHRFTRQVPGRRRAIFPFRSRTEERRPSQQLRDQRVA